MNVAVKTLYAPNTVEQMIQSGKRLLIAGDEKLLRQLPRGYWLGGTIPYFMSDEGGMENRERLYVDELPEEITIETLKQYNVEQLSSVTNDAPENGVSFIIIPGFSAALKEYSENAIYYENIFTKPIIGWVSGVYWDDIGKVTPKVFNGITGEITERDAMVLHCSLPEHIQARPEIINLFTQGDGDIITFEQTGFEQHECLINGVRTNFAHYIAEHNPTLQLPLVADYHGAMINVSFQAIDIEAGRVVIAAPALLNIKYKLAKPLQLPYEQEFHQHIMGKEIIPIFSCNCFLNYVYAGLQGKRINFTGPMTFGEINYVLFNQTLVYVSFEKIIPRMPLTH